MIRGRSVAALFGLVEKPRRKILVGMRRAVGKETPAMLRTVLLVVTAVKKPRPTPFFRSGNQGVGINGFDHRSVVTEFIAHFIHGGADGMDVAMGRMPNAPFVVHEVEP